MCALAIFHAAQRAYDTVSINCAILRDNLELYEILLCQITLRNAVSISANDGWCLPEYHGMVGGNSSGS